MTDIAAVAFTPAPAGDSPNLRKNSSWEAHQAFLRLIVVCFSSLRRWNPSLELILVSTENPPPKFAAQLDSLGARTLVTKFAHQPPPGFHHNFNASLFTIDAAQALADTAPNSRILLLDPDVVCSGPLDALFAMIDSKSFLTYDTGFPATEVSQGLSAEDAQELHAELDPHLNGTPKHFGGELYGFTTGSWNRMAHRVEQAWCFSLDRWRVGASRLVTEEHLLNYSLRYVPVLSANAFVRRIWTAPTYRTVKPSDMDLLLWHLPAEKSRGLTRLYHTASRDDSWFWTQELSQWRLRTAQICGLTAQRTPSRWTYDSLAAHIRTLQHGVVRTKRLLISEAK